MRHLSALLLTLLCWSFAAQTISAQSKILIKGTVTDADGQPVVSATVVGNNRESGTYTDDKGYYEIQLSKRDTVVIEYRYPNLIADTVEIVDPTQSEYTYDIELKFKEEEVVVIETEGISTKAEEMTSSVDVVSAKSVSKMADTDIVSTLRNVPGLTLYDDQPSIRGSSGYTYGVGSRVLTLLNGLPMMSANRSCGVFRDATNG